MPKNGTLQSLIKGVFIFSILYIGIFSANYASATIIDTNQTFDSAFIPLDEAATERIGIFYYSPESTVSISDITFKQMADSTATVNAISIQGFTKPTCTVGGTTYNSATISINPTVYSNYTYNFSSPVSLTPDKCWQIKTNYSTTVGQNNDINTGLSSTGGTEDPLRTFCTSGTGGCESNLKTPELPYFTLYDGLTGGGPEISITNPAIDQTIYMLPITYGGVATFSISNTIRLDWQLRYYDNNALVYSKITRIYPGDQQSPLDWDIVEIENLANGTYILTARITDETTQLWQEKSRIIEVALTNNPYAPPEEDADETCAFFTGTFDLPICKVLVMLFRPSNDMEQKIALEKENILDHAPISYVISLRDEFDTITATETETIDLIPEVIDNIFKWFYYLLFLIIGYKFTSKLFTK